MPNGRITTKQDCLDFIDGCLFMGTGGGGSPEEGLELLEEALAAGLELKWVDADAVDDHSLTVTAFAMGSIAPVTDETVQLIDELGLAESPIATSMLEAVRVIEAHLGERVGCLVPAELGAFNSPAPLVVAAQLGIDCVDGDYAGRAVPDEMQTTPFLNGKPGEPFASVDPWGNTAIVTAVANPYMLERVGKMLSVAGILGTAMAATPLPGVEMKEIVVRSTLSRCLEIGRAARRARDEGEDPIAAAVEVTGGYRMFDGVVVHKEWEDRDGYMFGDVHIEGTGSDEGHDLRVWFKNENHVTWLDGRPWVCSPDLISMLDPATGVGYTNTDISEGNAVAVVGVRGLEVSRNPEVLDSATGPRYYGFDVDYIPIERLLGEAADNRQAT